MVRGLDIFRDHFKGYGNHFISKIENEEVVLDSLNIQGVTQTEILNTLKKFYL